ncbi:ribosome silencing factor [Mesoaciditoga lauensis]|uniref:ribosome silencing factor n=1 Tax=Mesoaciditoga lauensis TaxID=1495039 RepID=UPI000B140F5C|nr:ribosome silencing factor [Mesoaciditoga lauensis]
MGILKRVCDEILKDEDADLTVLKMAELSYMTDYFVIATADSNVQMKSMRDRIIETLKEVHHPIVFYDKNSDHDWMIVDAGEVVIHIFTKKAREFYDLESLWSDAERVDPSKEDEG